jgi:hypothetical protein
LAPNSVGSRSPAHALEISVHWRWLSLQLRLQRS